MELQLSDEDRLFQNEVREFLDTHLSEDLREGARMSPSVFVEPDIALPWQKILNDKGWLVHHWPKAHGGQGWTAVQKYIFERECALADAPALSVLGLKLLGPVICEFGSDKQKADLLPRIRTGEDYWCQGFSEPGAGSDLASLKTSAVLKDGKYVVNGSKLWTTHAHHANKIFALVRTNQDIKPQLGISFLLIDMDQPGVTISPIKSMSHDHEVNQVFLDDAVADVDNLVGEEGQGWTIAKFLLENERGGSCFGPKLLADLDQIRLRAERTANGHRGMMSASESFKISLAELTLEAQSLETTELRLLAELSQGRAIGPNSSIVKLVASDLRQKVDSLALSLSGYSGLNLECMRPLYGKNRPPFIDDEFAQMAAPSYLNGRAWTIFGGSNEVQRTIIAKTVLGL